MKKYLILLLLLLLLLTGCKKEYDGDYKYYIYVGDRVFTDVKNVEVYKDRIAFQIYDNYYEIYEPENVVIVRCE